MDASLGKTMASIEPPRTIISMEVEDDDVKKFHASNDVITSTCHVASSELQPPQQDIVSPGGSSSSSSSGGASTHRSAVLSVPVSDIVTVPRLDPCPNENARLDLPHADPQALRRVSQETMHDNHSTGTDDIQMLPKASSNSDNDTLDVETCPRSRGKKIEMSIVDSDESATEKLVNDNTVAAEHTKQNDDEEGIVIDPDNDEATKTAICSLIQIGSRVAVYSEFNHQFFPGTITDRKYRGKPFYIEYDDEDEEAEWIDLRKQRFRLLPCTSTTTTALLSSSSSSSSSSIRMAPNESTTALGTNGYRSTRRSRNLHLSSSERKSPYKQPTSTNTTDPLLKSHETTSAVVTKTIPPSKRSSTAAAASKQMDSPALPTITKRSERSATKPLRFQDLCDTTDSDEGMNVTPRRKKRMVDKSSEVDDEIAQITIGTRVAVWWAGDQQYYNAVVTRQRTYKKPFYIEYEGTDETEWIDFRKNKFKILPPNPTAVVVSDHAINDNIANMLGSSKKVSSPKRFRLGSPEKTNHLQKNDDNKIDERTGTEKKRKRAMEHLDDDDSIDEVSGIANNEDVCNLITVGSRVSVFWEGDSKYYDGSVTRERKNAATKHYLEYDDGEAAHWINFREHWVRLLPPQKEVSTSNAVAKKKRKVDDDVDMTTQKSKRSVLDKILIATVKEDSNKKTTALKHDSKQQLPDKANNSRVTKKQKVVKSNAKASNVDESSETTKVTVGTRVEVWWDGDGRFYEGTIIKLGPNQNRKHFIRYDDNEEAWVYFARNRVRILNPTGDKTVSKSNNEFLTTESNDKPNNTARKKNKGKILSKSVGIASTKTGNTVVKKNDKAEGKQMTTKKVDSTVGKGSAKKVGTGASSHAGKGVAKKVDEPSVVVEKRINTKKVVKPISKKVESESENSDDNDDASLDDHYAYRDFVYGNVAKLKVGSRISVWWSSSRRYFDGTIKKIDSTLSSRRPYFIKYDDNDTEWTDLRRRYFRFLD